MNHLRQYLPSLSSALLLAAAAAVALPQAQAQAQDQVQAAPPGQDAQPAAAAAARRAKARAESAAAKRGTVATAGVGERYLALQAPPLSHLYPREELRYLLAQPDEEDNDTELPAVSVEGSRSSAVPVPMGQFLAIPWAILHPTQAWRIFTPVEQP